MNGDPATGQRTGPEPLLTLASFRRRRAVINFGVLLGVRSGSGGKGVGGNSGSGGSVNGVLGPHPFPDSLKAEGRGMLTVGTLVEVSQAGDS